MAGRPRLLIDPVLLQGITIERTLMELLDAYCGDVAFWKPDGTKRRRTRSDVVRVALAEHLNGE